MNNNYNYNFDFPPFFFLNMNEKPKIELTVNHRTVLYFNDPFCPTLPLIISNRISLITNNLSSTRFLSDFMKKKKKKGNHF